jgi:hypothetical protein
VSIALKTGPGEEFCSQEKRQSRMTLPSSLLLLRMREVIF